MGLFNRHRLWQVAVDAVLVGIAWYATYVVGFQIQRNPGWDAYWKQTFSIVKFPQGVIIHPQASAGQKKQLAWLDCNTGVKPCLTDTKRENIEASLLPRA